MVQLDGNFELVSTPEHELINDYGKFVFKAEMNNANILTISSIKIVQLASVSPSSISQVLEMEGIIGTLKTAKIVLKKI